MKKVVLSGGLVVQRTILDIFHFKTAVKPQIKCKGENDKMKLHSLFLPFSISTKKKSYITLEKLNVGVQLWISILHALSPKMLCSKALCFPHFLKEKLIAFIRQKRNNS